jgi:hypothetical protein
VTRVVNHRAGHYFAKERNCPPRVDHEIPPSIGGLRYSRVAPEKSPTSRKINQSALADVNICRDEVADVLMDVLLHGICADRYWRKSRVPSSEHV